MKTKKICCPVSTKGIICTIFLWFGCLPAFCQYVLSKDDLIDQGTTAYNSHSWIDASIYLFAYIQLNPAELSGDQVYANQVTVACQKSITLVSRFVRPRPSLIFSSEQLSPDVSFQRAKDAEQQNDLETACVYFYAAMERSAVNGQIDQQYTTYFSDLKQKLQQSIQNPHPGDAVFFHHAEPPIAPLPSPHHLNFNNPAAAYHVPTVTSAAATNPFSVAFQEAFAAASSNFAGLRGDAITEDNFRTNVIVGAPITATTNIFYRSNRWAFRFNITGASNDEASYFDLFSATVEQTLSNHHLKYSKTNLPYGKGDVSLQSFQYYSSENLIQVTRSISGNTFYDEVIIFHPGS